MRGCSPTTPLNNITQTDGTNQYHPCIGPFMLAYLNETNSFGYHYWLVVESNEFVASNRLTQMEGVGKTHLFSDR